jgi:hypothetical protein
MGFFQFKGYGNAKAHVIRLHGPPQYVQCTFCEKVQSFVLIAYNIYYKFSILTSADHSADWLVTDLVAENS